MRTSREQDKLDQKKTFWAVLFSIAFHLTLILLLAIVLANRFNPPPPTPSDETPMEITFVPPEPTPPPPKKREYIATVDSQKAEKPPDQPAFESDKDTHAASMLPPTGSEPVPSQEGINLPFVSFENKQAVIGPTPRPANPVAPPPQVTKPEPVSTPEPSPTPETTPSPTPKPRPSDFALLEPPKPKPRNTPQPQTPKTPPQPPSPPSRPGYQPETQITRIQGGISTRGPSSVNALATPLGRYNKAISDAVGSRWTFKINEIRDLLKEGTLEVRFVVKANGKIEKIRTMSNTSNGPVENVSFGAIQDASDSGDIPPIPKDIVPQLQNGSLEVSFSFTIL